MSRPNRSRSSATASRACMFRASSACHITDRLQTLGRAETSTSRVTTTSETNAPNSSPPGTPAAASSATTATEKAAAWSRKVRTGTIRTYGMANATGRSSTSSTSPSSFTPPTAASATRRPVISTWSAAGRRNRPGGNGAVPR